MKKKGKKVTKKRKDTQLPKITRFYIGIAAVIIPITIFGLVSRFSSPTPRVLGTSIYLAHAGQSHQTSIEEKTHRTSQKSGMSEKPVDAQTIVECSGPDDKQFRTTFAECKKFNHAWNNHSYTFLPLSDAETKNTSTQTERVAKKLTQQKVFTNTQRQVKESFDSTGSAQVVVQQEEYTIIGTQAAVKVNGYKKKKLLGIIPVSFAKTAYVSTESGNIVKIDQTFGTKILEFLSF